MKFKGKSIRPIDFFTVMYDRLWTKKSVIKRSLSYKRKISLYHIHKSTIAYPEVSKFLKELPVNYISNFMFRILCLLLLTYKRKISLYRTDKNKIVNPEVSKFLKELPVNYIKGLHYFFYPYLGCLEKIHNL